MKNTRSNSAIELLRIILLFFLVITHSFFVGIKYSSLDTRVIHIISTISVVGFATVTGFFIYNNDSEPLFGRNIQRLIFVIIVSIIIGVIIFYSLGKGKNIAWNKAIFFGSRDSWYLYAVLPIYFFAPFLKEILNSYSKILSLAMGLFIIGAIVIGKNFVFFGRPGQSMFARTAYGSMFLFGITLIAFYLSGIMKTNIKMYVVYSIIITIIVIYIIDWYMPIKGQFKQIFIGAEHQCIFNIVLAMSIAKLAHWSSWESKTVNWIAKRTNYVYEFHWLIQMIWVYFFNQWTKDNNHLAFYISSLAIFSIAWINSFLITELYGRVWIKITNPLFILLAKKMGKYN